MARHLRSDQPVHDRPQTVPRRPSGPRTRRRISPASCLALLALGFITGCTTGNTSRTSGHESAALASSTAWRYEPHSWAKLEAINAWLASPEAARDSGLAVEARLQLAEGRLEFARAERRSTEPGILRQRLGMAEQGFRGVLAASSASALQESRARLGLRSVEQLGAREGSSGPPVIARAQWGTETAIRSRMDAATGNWRRITVHHSSESRHVTSTSLAGAVQATRGIQRYHMHDPTRLYGDLGYHFVIGPGGHVLQARSLQYKGAHAYKQNNVENIGICVLGDWEDRAPPEAALRALEQTLDWLRQSHGIARASVKSHKDYRITVCPGVQLERWVQRYAGRD